MHLISHLYHIARNINNAMMRMIVVATPNGKLIKFKWNWYSPIPAFCNYSTGIIRMMVVAAPDQDNEKSKKKKKKKSNRTDSL